MTKQESRIRAEEAVRLWAEYQTLGPMTRLKPEGSGHGSARNDGPTPRQFAGWQLVDVYLSRWRYGQAMRALIAHVVSQGGNAADFRLLRRSPQPGDGNTVIYLDLPVTLPPEIRELGLGDGKLFDVAYRTFVKRLAGEIERRNLTIEPELELEVD